MAQWLNKLCFATVILIAAEVHSQSVADNRTKDYKDPKTHEKFRTRRQTVSQWQVNQLKQGALVVRLATRQRLIDELKKRGEDVLAEKARLEQAAINKNTIRAFADNYDFGKVYFIYSNSSDSLLNGARSGIFVDSTLKVNPAIELPGDFYLIAESDYVYNSTIGFVPEDSARHVIEQGNPSSSEFVIVVKNKYGHQLREPFPFSASNYVFTKNISSEEVVIDGKPIRYSISTVRDWYGATRQNGSTHTINGTPVELSIPRAYTYEALSQVVKNFNADLSQFYQRSERLDEKSEAYADAKPFMY